MSVFFCFSSYELAEECADDEDDKAAIRKLRKRVKQKLKGLDSLVRVSFSLFYLPFSFSFWSIFVVFSLSDFDMTINIVF